MAHFAKVKNRKVLEVIVAEQDFIDSLLKEAGVKWVQTSYNTLGNVHYKDEEHIVEFDEDGTKKTFKSMKRVPSGQTPLRKNYAGVGYTYDSGRDAFYSLKPYASWTLNEDTCLWEAPTAMPDNDKFFQWDESKKEWVEVE
jgi:hypothetical protein